MTLSLLPGEKYKTIVATPEQVRSASDFYYNQYLTFRNEMPETNFARHVIDVGSVVSLFCSYGPNVVIAFASYALEKTTPTQRERFTNASLAASTTLENLEEHLKEKRRNSGAVRFELKQTIEDFKTSSGLVCGVFKYAVITGYYNENGDKFTQ